MKGVTHKRLPNGMDVYTQEDSATHLMAVGVKSGGFSDPTDKVGLAHFAEHFVARGPKGVSGEQFDRRLRALGCAPGRGIDIFTTYETTYYGTDMLLRRSYALEFFNYAAKMIVNPTVNLEGRNAEFGAVKTEYLLHGIDNMLDIIDGMMSSIIYKTNPRRRRLDCELDQLQRVTTSDVRTFIKEHYVPNNMYAILLGPKNTKALELAMKYFGDMKPSTVPKTDYDQSDNYPRLTSTPTNDNSLMAIRKGITTHHAAIGFPVEPYTPGLWKPNQEFDKAVDAVAIEVLAEIVEHRMHNVLRESGHLTYHPYVYLDVTKSSGMFYIWFPTSSEDKVYRGIDLIVKDLENIKNGGITKDQFGSAVRKISRKNGHHLRRQNVLYGVEIPQHASFEAARAILKNKRANLQSDVEMGVKALKTDHWESYETSSGLLAGRIIQATCSGDIKAKWINRRHELLNRVGKDKIVEIANRVFTTPDNFALAYVAPEPNTAEMIFVPNFYKGVTSQGKLF